MGYPSAAVQIRAHRMPIGVASQGRTGYTARMDAEVLRRAAGDIREGPAES
jgi:hypothetical protein